MGGKIDSEQFSRNLLIADKESELVDLDARLKQECYYLISLNNAAETIPSDVHRRRLVLDARAAIEDTLLTIRRTENELHALGAKGWV